MKTLAFVVLTLLALFFVPLCAIGGILNIYASFLMFNQRDYRQMIKNLCIAIAGFIVTAFLISVLVNTLLPKTYKLVISGDLIALIATILSIVVALVIGAVLWLWFLNKRTNRNASVTAIIDIFPSGKPLVEFIPSANLEDTKLMKLALLYAAKIKYVLGEENPEVIEIYERLLQEVVASPEIPEDDNFIERLSKNITTIYTQDDFPMATKTGERYTIRLVEGTRTFVNNDLPIQPRGLAANIPISVLLLIHAVAVRLSKENVLIFEEAFSNLNKVMFDGSKPKLFALNQAALGALSMAS